jgi:hypothetical protein
MVFLDVGVLALLIGKLLGGSLSALADTKIRAVWLAPLAVGLQIIAFPSGVLPWSTPTALAKPIWLLTYAMLIAMLLLNVRLRGASIVALGLFSNLAAILANGGLMPVRVSALRAAKLSYHIHNNSIELARPQLGWLVDRWAAPAWVPLANVYSVGDVIIGVGTLVLIVAAMRAERQPEPVAAVPAVPALAPAAKR